MSAATVPIELSALCSLFRAGELHLRRQAVMNAVCALARGLLDWPWGEGGGGLTSLPLLHFLLPLAGVLLLWRKRDILSRILIKVDRSLSAFCPSLSKSQRFLRWASGQLPPTWSSQLATLSGGIPELWRDGSLLCALVNSAVPGACPNPHRHWRRPPSHGQQLALKYLGVEPVFSDSDFKEKTLTISLEQKFIRFLTNLQQSMIKLNAKSESYSRKCSSHYVARGMGLVTGEQNKDTVFYIYSTSKSSVVKDVVVSIRGPYSSFGTATIPAFRNTSLMRKQGNKKLIYETKPRRSFLQVISMDFMASDRNATSIPLKVEMESDRAIVTFIPTYTGMYQVVLTSNNEHLAGSPYNLRIMMNDGCDDDYNTGNNVKMARKKIFMKLADFIDENLVVKKTFIGERTLFPNPDEDFEFSFRTKRSIIIPDTGYAVKRVDNIEAHIDIAEKKQHFEKADVAATETNPTPNEAAEKSVSVSPDEFTSSLCETHTVPEVQSGEELELSTFSFTESAVEDDTPAQDTEMALKKLSKAEVPKAHQLKAFIREKKEYWDHLISMNMENNSKSVPVNLNLAHLDARRKDVARNRKLERSVSKSVETIDRKLDFDFSLDESVELKDSIPSVKDRKSLLIEQLTDEQKLLKIQNEKNLEKKASEALFKTVRKPSRHESFNSVIDRIKMFNNAKLYNCSSCEEYENSKENQEDEAQNFILEPTVGGPTNFASARNYFKTLEQSLICSNNYNSLDSGFRKKHNSKCGSLRKASEMIYSDFIYDDIIGSRKCPQRICMESFVFHVKYRRKNRKVLIALFDFDRKR